MIRRSLLAVAAVIAFSAVAASTQAFADADANNALPDCTALADAFVLPSSAGIAARH